MNKGIFVAGLACLLVLHAGSTAWARQAPLVDPPYQKLETASGAVVTRTEVEAAIRDGARAQEWEVVSSEPGKIRLHRTIRTHQMDVLVSYDDHGFDLDYVSSVDLNYEQNRKGSFIHPGYNAWVFGLTDAIATSPTLEPGYVAPVAGAQVQAVPPVVTTLTLTGPIHLSPALSYRRGYYVDPEIKEQCPWNRGYAGMARVYGKGLIAVTNEDLSTLPGYTVRATVLNLRAAPLLGGPKWAAIRVQLFQDGKLIGETEQRRVTNVPPKGGCSALNKIAAALAEDTVAWLRAGHFEVQPDRHGMSMDAQLPHAADATEPSTSAAAP